VYFGDNGPINTFKEAGPRLGAKIERDISIGGGFIRDAGQSWQ